MKDKKAKIRAFLKRFIRHHFQDDEDIFESGYVNSMIALQLVLFVESEFDITVENEDLKLENFSTVNALVRLIEYKTI
jgi:acyl carrier protein